MTIMETAHELLNSGLERSLSSQQRLARANVERLRRLHPDKSPEECINYLGWGYLSAVTVTGAGAGMAAAVPGAGLAVGVPAAIADVITFTEASVLYVLSVAEIHDLHPGDLERRRLLVMAVMLGDSATGALQAGVGRTAPHWAQKIVTAIPMEAINRVNKVLGPRFVTKYGTKQGVLVIGLQLPLGIGSVLGSGANHLVGRGVIASARMIFGEPPVEWSPARSTGEPNDARGSQDDLAQ